jgi:hypothetical protein
VSESPERVRGAGEELEEIATGHSPMERKRFEEEEECRVWPVAFP